MYSYNTGLPGNFNIENGSTPRWKFIARDKSVAEVLVGTAG